MAWVNGRSAYADQRSSRRPVRCRSAYSVWSYLSPCVLGCQKDNKVECSIQSSDHSFGPWSRLAVSTFITPLASAGLIPQQDVRILEHSRFPGCLPTLHLRLCHVYNSPFHRLRPGRGASESMSRTGNPKTRGRGHRGCKGFV